MRKREGKKDDHEQYKKIFGYRESNRHDTLHDGFIVSLCDLYQPWERFRLEVRVTLDL